MVSVLGAGLVLGAIWWGVTNLATPTSGPSMQRVPESVGRLTASVETVDGMDAAPSAGVDSRARATVEDRGPDCAFPPPSWAKSLERIDQEIEFTAGEAPFVQVVRGRERVPVAGAHVAFFRWEETPRPGRLDGEDGRSIHALASKGLHGTTDEHGCAPVRLQVSRRPEATWSTDGSGRTDPSVVVVGAWSDGDFGWTRMRVVDIEPRTRFEVVLHRDNELRVRVLDADGAPAQNVKVGFYRWQPKKCYRFLNLQSDAEGIVRVRHLRAEFGSDTDRLVIVAEIHADPLPHLVVRADDRAEEHVLRLPPTGTTSIAVVSTDGHHYRADSLMRVSPRRHSGEFQVDGSIVDVPYHRLDYAHGVTRVEWCGVGVTLVVRTTMFGVSSNETKELHGPTAQGVDVRRDFVWDRLDEAVLIAKIEFPGLDPRPGGTYGPIQVYVLSDGESRRCRQRTVLEDRRFEIGYRPMPIGKQRLFAEMDVGGRTLVAWREFTTSKPGGERIELGNLEFVPTEIVARGRVLDESDNPVARQDISLMVQGNREGGATPHHWIHLGVETGDDGSFEIRGPRFEWPCVLELLHPSYHPLRVPVRADGSYHDLRMIAYSSLEVRALFDPEVRTLIPASLLTASILGPGLWRDARMTIDESGEATARILRIDPGDYELAIRVSRWTDPLFTAPVHVTKGKNVYPQIVDLRSSVYRYAFDVVMPAVDLDGRNAAMLVVVSREPGGDDGQFLYSKGNRLEFAVPYASLEYHAHVDGCGIVTGIAAPGATQIRFEASPKIDFELRGLGDLLAGIPRMAVHLEFELLGKGATTECGPKAARAMRSLDTRYRQRRKAIVQDRASARFEYPNMEYAVRLDLASLGAGRPLPVVQRIVELARIRPADCGTTMRIDTSGEIARAVDAIRTELDALETQRK
ncbi:MAG: hypothetical protein H6832_05580 [Planctomycetes bacterium]|nr:hypothetical protein [Planctomycetota bacterium]